MNKLLLINDEGTFIDGCRISDVTICDIGLHQQSDIKFKIAVSETGNSGGLTIYERNFGNYDHDLVARVLFDVVNN
ncbi:hypothetical protein [Paenibacillus sp. sgz500958]|uniref:hypothetical protein n=1 Tax=Paenibacillus sp. sgz500958 TaxID=3242475 RepID=UPI0036D3F7C7